MNTSTQSAGMLSTPAPAQPQQQGAYNGTVDVMGEPVEVVNGVAEVEGEKYFVSNNGKIVINSKHQVFGYIEDGVFKPLDRQHYEMLKAEGLIEEPNK